MHWISNSALDGGREGRGREAGGKELVGGVETSSPQSCRPFSRYVVSVL